MNLNDSHLPLSLILIKNNVVSIQDYSKFNRLKFNDHHYCHQSSTFFRNPHQKYSLHLKNKFTEEFSPTLVYFNILSKRKRACRNPTVDLNRFRIDRSIERVGGRHVSDDKKLLITHSANLASIQIIKVDVLYQSD